MSTDSTYKNWFRDVKVRYIAFLDCDKKTLLSKIVYFFLVLLSYIYGIIVFLRNRGYDYGILPVYSSCGRIISVGNISWGGSGKTSLVSYLHKNLSSYLRVATITKGYAKDEFLLLKDKLTDVFDAKRRLSLLKSLENKFDVFILDDGFQYRRLRRDLDIVVIGPKECGKNQHLLPAYILREPLSSIRRAQIVVINYSHLIGDLDLFKKRLLYINPRLRIYTSRYVYRRFLDRNKKEVGKDYFRGKHIAVLTAVGYPQGFIEILNGLPLNIVEKLIYPDHYEFEKEELMIIENRLRANNIKDIIITYKDFYHLDLRNACLNYFILDVDLKIDNEEDFLSEVKKNLGASDISS